MHNCVRYWTLAALNQVIDVQGYWYAFDCVAASTNEVEALGAKHTSTLDTVNNLGLLYRAQGKLAEAGQMCLRALAGYEKALGADHTSTLKTVNNLGALYDAQGKLAEAEQMYLRALTGFRTSLGSEHPSTVTVTNNLKQLVPSDDKNMV
jgi:tetratricopeptide (TPR) repeat protein